MESENVTDGLRESSRYASDRNVVISNTRSTPSTDRRFAPIVPNASPWFHTASAQPPMHARIWSGRASVVRSKSKPSITGRRRRRAGRGPRRRRGTGGARPRRSARRAGSARPERARSGQESRSARLLAPRRGPRDGLGSARFRATEGLGGHCRENGGWRRRFMVGPSILSEERRTLHCGEVDAPFAAAATSRSTQDARTTRVPRRDAG